jgi:mono/diheme cytochrome c family protein
MLSMKVTPRRALALLPALGLLLVSIPLLAQGERWNIPQNAASETNPVARTDAVLAKGKDLYKSKCQKCHGPMGKGDGPEADPDHAPDDLTDPARSARNPDGVVFYKVWNGRSKPKMPAASTDMSKDEVWTVVHYVQTLRK